MEGQRFDVISGPRYVLETEVLASNERVLNSLKFADTGPVKLIEWVKIAHLFLRYVKTVSAYNFKLVWVVLHPSFKEFCKTIHWQEQNNDVLFIEPFQLILKFHSFILPSEK